MNEPPILLCATCRGHGGDCTDCNGAGSGIPVEWLNEHADEWEIVSVDGQQFAQPRAPKRSTAAICRRCGRPRDDTHVKSPYFCKREPDADKIRAALHRAAMRVVKQ